MIGVVGVYLKLSIDRFQNVGISSANDRQSTKGPKLVVLLEMPVGSLVSQKYVCS